jgi:rRNA maturation RNase YbeY
MPDFPPEAPGYDSPVTIDVDHPDRSLNEREVADLVRRVVDGEDLHLRHVSVVLSGHDTVRHLNREYLDHDYNTDVLSFSLDETEDIVEGEVYVDLDTAAERYEEFGTSFDEEARRYVVHGVLHLAGYDDATDDQREEMRRLEDRYLSHPT